MQGTARCNGPFAATVATIQNAVPVYVRIMYISLIQHNLCILGKTNAGVDRGSELGRLSIRNTGHRVDSAVSKW